MGWLGTRLRKKPSEDETVEQELVPELPSGPPLILLVPEIAGGSSYRLHEFYDVEPAIEVIESTIPAIRAGIHAFWALQERPLDSTDIDPKGEGMVLIRTNPDSDTVYVVSFVDIESGESFARFEVKRGLDLGLVMIYWASHVEVDQTGAGFSLSPVEPPATAASEQKPLRDWTRPVVVAAAATATPSEKSPVVDPPVTPAPEVLDSTALADPPTRVVAPGDASRQAQQAAGERYRQDEADAAGMIEEEAEEPRAMPDLAASATMNGNGKNGHGAEATLETTPTESPIEADASPMEVTAFAGDEEIADRILHEALGDDPIDLVSGAELSAATAVADEIPPETPTRTVDAEPELDLFHGPPKTSRSRKKTPPPSASAEIAAALSPEPETPVVESVAGETLPVEAAVEDTVVLLEPEPEDSLEVHAAVEETEPVTLAQPVPIVAEVAPVVEEAPAADEAPVFTPAPEVAAEAAAVFASAPGVSERQPAFTPLDSENGAEAVVASASAGEPEDQDAVAQVEKILRIPRWEKKEDPFKGFNSPPGRF